MTNLSVTNQKSSGSPFDSIRVFDEQGHECWYARDLMKMMGYTNWKTFTRPITDAWDNIECTDGNACNHLLRLTSTVRGQKKRKL